MEIWMTAVLPLLPGWPFRDSSFGTFGPRLLLPDQALQLVEQGVICRLVQVAASDQHKKEEAKHCASGGKPNQVIRISLADPGKGRMTCFACMCTWHTCTNPTSCHVQYSIFRAIFGGVLTISWWIVYVPPEIDLVIWFSSVTAACKLNQMHFWFLMDLDQDLPGIWGFEAAFVWPPFNKLTWFDLNLCASLRLMVQEVPSWKRNSRPTARPSLPMLSGAFGPDRETAVPAPVRHNTTPWYNMIQLPGHTSANVCIPRAGLLFIFSQQVPDGKCSRYQRRSCSGRCQRGPQMLQS